MRPEHGCTLNSSSGRAASQVLVATEAAGEGINLQCCHILFNYDIPWNPNRLEQRMGRIHRYLQTKDCLIFNFVATNTIEGHVLQKLLDKLQEIRDALESDSVFNVVGEILPPNEIERILRDYYAGKIGNADLEERLLRDVKEDHFRAICQNALEGLATKKLNLEMLIERERGAGTSCCARDHCPVHQRLGSAGAFDTQDVRHACRTPSNPRRHRPFVNTRSNRTGSASRLRSRYPRFSTDREVADTNNLEWVTPGHPLFEALRRHARQASETPCRGSVLLLAGGG